MVATLACTLAVSVALSAIGWKLRSLAAALAWSKFRPDAAKICSASGRWIQLSNAVCSAAGSWRTMSNWVLVLEFLTVFQP
jgi:hypothetical protein